MRTSSRPQKAWMVRLSPGAGPGDQVPDGLRSDNIFIGWSPLPQLLEPTLDREDFRRLMREVVISERGMADEVSLGKWVGDAWRFIREMRVGDLVVVPHGADLYIAEVTGNAYFDGTFTHLDASIRRPVRFANGKRPVPRSFVTPGLQKTLRARQPCIELREHLPEVRSLTGIG